MSIPTEYPYDFDPTYGLSIEQLHAIEPPAPPPDFDAFWQMRYRRALEIDPKPRLADSASAHPGWRVHDLIYTSTDAFPIGGWLLVPRDGRVERGLVVGHGYGGRDAPDYDIPVTRTALLFPCFRGLSRSARPPISSDPNFHVLDHIGDPERYILGGCVEDLWVAVSVLQMLFPALGSRIGYSGISFGGGIGALAMAQDRRIDRGQLTVPTFGNMPLWLRLPTTGSGHAVQRYRKTHPGVIETLRLFDAASAASRIAQPTLLALARFDPAVAPPCQFSIGNALDRALAHAAAPSKHHQTFILDAGHFAYPGEEEQHALLSARIEQFFAPP